MGRLAAAHPSGSSVVVSLVSHRTNRPLPFPSVSVVRRIAPVTAETFIAAFRERAAHCRALLELSTEQARLIERNDAESLIELLEHKQQLLNHLTDAGPAQNAFVSWPQAKHALGRDDRGVCESLLDQIDASLRQLQSTEQRDFETMVARRDEQRRELDLVNAAIESLHAYQSGPAPPTDTFLNLQV